MLNKYDLFNPLYKHQTSQESEKPTEKRIENAKDAKRSDKTTQEAIMKSSKDTNEVIENKIQELGLKVNENTNNRLKEGFNNLSEQLSELVKFLKNKAIEKKLHDQPDGRNREQNQKTNPTQEQTPRTHHEEPSQPPVTKPTNEYKQILERFNTLPPGQQHLTTDWAEESKFPEDGAPDEPEVRDKERETKSPTQEQPNIDEIKTIINAMNARMTQLENDNIKKHMDAQHEIKKLKEIIENGAAKEPTIKKLYSQAAAGPSIPIDMDRNEISKSQQRDNIQPIDTVKVKNARSKLPPRPNLSSSTHLEAQSKLKEHNIETRTKIEDDKVKIRKQHNITKQEEIRK